jgi:alpha-1,6-mannosyltransferase
MDGAGLVCAISYCVLAWLSLHPESLSLQLYYLLLGICLTATLVAFNNADEKSLTPMKLLLWAGCFRLIGIWGDPLWEDDFFRYLWDGYRFYETGSPYGVAPSSFFGDSNIPGMFYGLLAQVNYPDVPTIYGPTLQYTFLLGHLFVPTQIWFLQILYALADMGMILLLLRLANIRWVLLYAWSPLIIKELAFTAHPDGVGAVLMMLALYCRQRQQLAVSVSLLALSVGAKVFALLMVPFILWRLSFRYWVLFAVALLALYAPFIWQGATDMSGLLIFAREWQFNSSIFALLRQWCDPLTTKLILGVIFVFIYSVLFWQHQKINDWKIPRGDIVFGVFLLIAPVVNAWYLVWLLPFAVLFPSVWSWTFSASVLLSYSIGINLNSTQVAPFEIPLWIIMLEYGTVIIAVSVDLWLRNKSKKPL